MNENPFESFKDFYDEAVVEQDKLGYSEYYLKAFNLFKEKFNKEDRISFTFTDVKYLSGYYLFISGTNSVVHFRIEECPGWKFGVWFTGETSNSGITVNAEFFCQYEDCIDKFKPSTSIYLEEFSVIFDNGREPYTTSTQRIYKTFKFIHEHPLRAWAADYYGYDYNLKYVSSIVVLWNFICFKLNGWKESVITSLLNKNMLDYTMKLFYPTIETNVLLNGWEVKIDDWGESGFPRYHVLIKLPNNSSEETGHFAMFLDQDLKEKWEKRKNLLYRIANTFNIWCFDPIRDSITFWKEKEQEEDV